jgi:Arc/MetJ-type ribon-helix-helix transcriptional regulator
MQKTSVYLSREETELLRSTAARTGRSRAELIREGVRLVTGSAEPATRAFRSMGRGHGGGAGHARWDADELYRRKLNAR